MAELDIKKAEELEEKYDSGLQTRVIGPYLVKFSFYFSIIFAAYHYVTAGIGVPIDLVRIFPSLGTLYPLLTQIGNFFPVQFTWH